MHRSPPCLYREKFIIFLGPFLAYMSQCSMLNLYEAVDSLILQFYYSHISFMNMCVCVRILYIKWIVQERRKRDGR